MLSKEVPVEKIRRLRWIIFGFFLALYSATLPINCTIGDFRFMLLVCQSLAEDGDIYIMDEGLREPEKFTMDTSKFPLVPSLVGVPFYLIGKWGCAALGKSPSNNDLLTLASFSTTFVAALTCVLLFQFVLALGFSARTALLSTAFFGLGTIIWAYSHVLSTDAIATLATLGAVYAAYQYKVKQKYFWIGLSGFFSGLGIGSRETLVLMVPPLLVYIIAAGWQHAPNTLWPFRPVRLLKQLLIFSLAFLPFVVLNAWYYLARYGILENIGYLGYYSKTSDLFKNPLFIGLHGLLLSPGKGLFLYCPIFILVFFSVQSFYQRYKTECILISVILLVQLLIYAKCNFWDGGGMLGPRYLLPIMPLLLLLMTPFIESLPKRSLGTKILVVLLFCASAALQTAPLWTYPSGDMMQVDAMVRKLDFGWMWFLTSNLAEYVPHAHPLLWDHMQPATVLANLYLAPQAIPSTKFYLFLLLVSTILSLGLYLIALMDLVPTARDLRTRAAWLIGRVQGTARTLFKYKLATVTGALALLVLSASGYVGLHYIYPAVKRFNSKPFGPIENPALAYPEKPTLTGAIDVGGWVVDRWPIQAVHVYIDNVRVAEATLGQESPDVYEVYPHLSNSRNARYIATGIESSAFNDGVHVLRIKALSQKGVWTEVASLAIILLNKLDYDFWQHLADAKPSRADAIQEAEFSIGAETRKIFLQTASSQVTFEQIPVHAGGFLKFGIGLVPEGELVEDNGLTLEVLANESTTPLFSLHIDPQKYAEQTQWLDQRIDLSPYQNQVISLTFNVKGTPDQVSHSTRIGWSDLAIIYPDPVVDLK